MKTAHLYPILLQASLHETLWGGRRLEQASWKKLPPGDVSIGEAWETEVSNSIQNGLYAGLTLGALVDEWGPALLGEQVLAIFGRRFPLLAKFLDANAQLSVQVHPDDCYAAQHEGGKLGKTEFWYILAAEPDAVIVYGFKAPTSRAEVQQAIQDVTLEKLLHEEVVRAGDVIYVPAGTVHAIGSGVLLYELQEYSDVTYRMYDYGRLTATGKPRELHVERSLEVAHYSAASHIKVKPVPLPSSPQHEDRCLIACQYFLTREIVLKQRGTLPGIMNGQTSHSCIILSSIGAEIKVWYGEALDRYETLARGQSMVLPAGLGNYRLEGNGVLLLSYVPEPTDLAWQLWQMINSESAS